MQKYGLGAIKSKIDVRDFSYKPDKANWKGGKRYNKIDIEDQSKVGICTAISLTQQARKATGIKYSADFQYLCQKLFYDKNWDEGSSIRNAIKVGYDIGLLPAIHWKYKISRKQPYSKYIEELKKIPLSSIEKLKKIAASYKIKGYASVPIDRDMLANAIDESEAGILTRMVVGSEWWTNPIEPLRYPKKVISGHAITASNYTGNSFRTANTWGSDWADKGTAYYMLKDNMPTEAWIVYYNKASKSIKQQAKKKKTVIGKVKSKIQKIIQLFQ